MQNVVNTQYENNDKYFIFPYAYTRILVITLMMLMIIIIMIIIIVIFLAILENFVFIIKRKTSI